MNCICKVPRLKFVLGVDAIIIIFLLWIAASSRMSYTFRDRCASVELPLGLVSGTPEDEVVAMLNSHDCHVDEKRKMLPDPCRVTMYRCSSYYFNGGSYLVDFEFLRGRLMSVAIQCKDDQSLGVGVANGKQIKRVRIGNWYLYTDVGMSEEAARFWQDYL